jgi:hypothetical protein
MSLVALERCTVACHHPGKVCPSVAALQVVLCYLSCADFSYWRWAPCTWSGVMKPEARVGTIRPSQGPK